MVAVVWREKTVPASRAESLARVLNKRNVTAQELGGGVRRQALKEFRSGTGWHRGADVDRLSQEEAGVIAARLVRRIHAQTPLSEEKAKTLEAAFTDVFKRRFTRDPDKPDQTPLDRRNDELLKLAREHLDEKGGAALKDAVASGLRPLPNER